MGKNRSYLIHLSSDADVSYKFGNTMRFSSNIKENIIIKDCERAFVSVRNVRIPNVMTQINNFNDTIVFRNTDTNITSNLILDHGNYTGIQLATYFENIVNGFFGPNFQVVFVPQTGKFNFQNQTANNLQIEWSANYDSHILFGFPLNILPLPISINYVESPSIAILNPIPEVYLNSSLNLLHVYDNRKEGRSNLLDIFPISNIPIGSDLFYSNQNSEFRAEFVGKHISDIELWLTDNKNRVISFTTGFVYAYEVTLLIQIECTCEK